MWVTDSYLLQSDIGKLHRCLKMGPKYPAKTHPQLQIVNVQLFKKRSIIAEFYLTEQDFIFYQEGKVE